MTEITCACCPNRNRAWRPPPAPASYYRPAFELGFYHYRDRHRRRRFLTYIGVLLDDQGRRRRVDPHEHYTQHDALECAETALRARR